MKVNGASESLINTIYALVSIPTLIVLYTTNQNLCAKPMFNPTKSKPNLSFGFPIPDYLWSNFIKNNFFRKKPFFFAKKINLKKIAKN